MLRDEVTPHAAFAVSQAMASPRLEIVHVRAVDLGGGTFRVEAGIANTGWLPTTVSARGAKAELTQPVVAEVAGEAIEVVGGPARVKLGQLAGRAALRFANWHDGTPDRVLATWVVRAAAGTTRRGRRPARTCWSGRRRGRARATAQSVIPDFPDRLW